MLENAQYLEQIIQNHQVLDLPNMFFFILPALILSFHRAPPPWGLQLIILPSKGDLWSKKAARGEGGRNWSKDAKVFVAQKVSFVCECVLGSTTGVGTRWGPSCVSCFFCCWDIFSLVWGASEDSKLINSSQVTPLPRVFHFKKREKVGKLAHFSNLQNLYRKKKGIPYIYIYNIYIWYTTLGGRRAPDATIHPDFMFSDKHVFLFVWRSAENSHVTWKPGPCQGRKGMGV